MSRYTPIEVSIIRTTDKALLADIDGDEVWIPFSQVEDNGEDLTEGFEGEIYVTEWWAEKEGVL